MTSTADPPLAGYRTTGAWDEAISAGGAVRPIARAALDAVAVQWLVAA